MKAVVENGKVDDDAIKLGLVLLREWSAVLDRLAVKEQIMQRRRQETRLRRRRRECKRVRRRGEIPASCCVLSSSVEGQQLSEGGQGGVLGLGKSSKKRPLELSGCGTTALETF